MQTKDKEIKKEIPQNKSIDKAIKKVKAELKDPDIRAVFMRLKDK